LGRPAVGTAASGAEALQLDRVHAAVSPTALQQLPGAPGSASPLFGAPEVPQAAPSKTTSKPPAQLPVGSEVQADSMIELVHKAVRDRADRVANVTKSDPVSAPAPIETPSQPPVSRPFNTPTAARPAVGQAPADPNAAPMWMKAVAIATLISAITVLTIFGYMVSQRL
jgi:hypothetical protein